MIFNPLKIPSHMNVGQLLECSLGLAGSKLFRHYRIAPFNERYEQEASKNDVFGYLKRNEGSISLKIYIFIFRFLSNTFVIILWGMFCTCVVES
jgi:hypothetical protein